MSLDLKTDLETLAEREARLAEAEEVAHMGSWVWQVPENEAFWSAELFRVLGLDPNQVSASTEAFFKAVHPEDLPGLQGDAARIAETGVSLTRTVRIVRPTGEVRVVRMTSKQVNDADGKAQRIVGTLLDITESLEQARERDRALENMRDAQRLANVGSWSWDMRDDSIVWSEQMFRIAELDPASHTPSVEGFVNLVHPEDMDAVRDAVRSYRRGDPCPITCRLVLASGEQRHVQIESSVASYDDGRPATIVGTMLDLTERKSLEDQLRQSQKMEALGQLAGGVAHDLNNYLQIIAGNIELLERDDPRRDPETRQARQDLRTTLQLCASLTQGLLAFTRRQTTEPRTVDLHRVIRNALALVGRLLGASIEVQTELEAPHAVVYCDPHQMEQVLFNLAINARDAMEEGGTLTVTSQLRKNYSLRPTPKAGEPAFGGDAIVIRITDTGCGMSEAVRSRIFDPFFTTKPKGRSTGLGLAIVHGIVHQTNGRIEVESRPDEGTSFVIELPLVDASVGYESSRPDEEAPEFEATQRILVVEDDKMVRRVTAITLRKAGYEVIESVDGEAALKIIEDRERENIHLVISDVMMPKLTGVELVEALARSHPQIPVLLMTGYAEQELVEIGPASDQAILFKPFPRADLLRAVDKLLEA